MESELIARDYYLRYREQEHLPHAFEEWKEYRDALTDYIIGATEPGSSVLILGAGYCDDIDIKKLRGHFSSIALCDRNEEAMYKAVKRYSEPERRERDDEFAGSNEEWSRDKVEESAPAAPVEVLKKDFVGIPDEEYIRFLTIAIDAYRESPCNFDIDRTVAESLERLEKIYASTADYNPGFGIRAYDYVVAVGVHSQLNNTFAGLWEGYLSSVGAHDERVAEAVRSHTEEIIACFDNAMLIAARKKVIVGIERGVSGTESAVDGAYQEFQHIKTLKAQKSINVLEWADMTWPFDVRRGLEYKMAVFNLDVL